MAWDKAAEPAMRRGLQWNVTARLCPNKANGMFPQAFNAIRAHEICQFLRKGAPVTASGSVDHVRYRGLIMAEHHAAETVHRDRFRPRPQQLVGQFHGMNRCRHAFHSHSLFGCGITPGRLVRRDQAQGIDEPRGNRFLVVYPGRSLQAA